MIDRRRLLTGVGAVLLAAAASGCAPPGPKGAPAAPGPAGPARAETQPIHVIATGWHSGLVIPRAAVPAGLLPEAADFPDARYLEAGWGDRAYYPNPRASLADALAAGLVPGPSILHLAGLAALPAPTADRAVWRVPIAAPGLARLVRAIHDTVERPPGGGRVAPVAPGLTPAGRFYPAHGRFHLFNTCNTWVARQLGRAGLAIAPGGIITAENLADRLDALPGARRLSADAGAGASAGAGAG
ncbi:DUF2459 domain-containing protein [Roseospira goensis]|uniref:Uncharacterized protein (TIGR02117 family) n=1 Tax=Roseospira goensis TaxID=391922 RepID=A0A7W6S1W6_9PROT|nr:DUF2459 domain-containing protein [Roseospira goensis]MBB4286662.1 uncharacterized protein (TIGR02117 family) [Roseospira goensis]